MTTLQKTLNYMAPEDLKIVGLDFAADPSHPLYDERVNNPLEGEKIEACDMSGVTTPIKGVRKKGEIWVVTGRHSTRYAREVNKLRAARGDKPLEVPVVLVPFTDELSLKTLMIQENMLRTELTPVDKGRYAQTLLAEFEDLDKKDAVQRVADLMGVTPQSIKDWTKVLSFEPKVVKAIETGKISAHKALKTFRKVPPEKQAEVLTELEKGLKEIEAEHGERPRKGKKSPPKRNMNKQYAREMAKISEEDAEKLGLCPIFHLGLRYAFGKATDTDCRRDAEGFQKALNWAKKALGEA